MAALLLGAAVASWLATRLVMRHALNHAILDLPNERSSHSSPTPRGGGLAIDIVVLIGLVAGYYSGVLPGKLTAALVGGGLAIAWIGWADDRWGLPVTLRAPVHVLAATWAVWLLGGLETVSLPHTTLYLGWLGSVLAIVGVVWMTNLYNFMDGIDGIAAVEAITVGGWAGLLFLLIGSRDLAFVALLISASSLGFVTWNWAPARIFLGDVGSGFLGFVLGTLAIAAERARPLSLLWLTILLGVFLVDATLTLLRRALHGESIHTAHRNHAYQRITRSGFSHAQVSSAVVLMNIILGCVVLGGVLYPSSATTMVAIGVGMPIAAYVWIENVRPMFERNGSPSEWKR